MLTTIFLSGELGKKFGRRHQFDIRTPKEALRAIEANQPGLAVYLSEATDRGIDFRITVGKNPLKDAALVDFAARGKTIRIAPVVRGAKDKSTGLIIGLVLVAVTWGAAAGYLGPTMMAAAKAAAFGGTTWGAVVGGIGVSMAVGGVAQMLSPTPKLNAGSAAAGTSSSSLGGPLNATVQGLPVPLVYGGPIVVGSIRISAGIKSEDKAGPTAAIEGQTGTKGEGAFTQDPDYPNYSTPATPSNTKARNLESVQMARILDLICEGEIEGLCDSDGNVLAYADRNKGIFFDKTQVQADDGKMNFKDAATAFRYGTNTQEYLPGFPETESPTIVGVEVIKGGDKVGNAVTRTIAAAAIDAVRVEIQIPALWKIDARGNQNAAAVHFSIQIKPFGGSWQEAVGSNVLEGGEIDGLIQGFATEAYSRSYRIPLEGAGPWDVRILKETDDAADSTKEQSRLFFVSYTTIFDQRLRYPNSVLGAVEVSSKLTSSIPETAYRIKGLKVKIPSNYNPVTRNYSGTWDGTFTTAWTNNPAWIVYDLITKDRYGLGKYIPAAYADKWALYAIARYCDGVDGSGNFVGVDNGAGGTEPRYTMNVSINSISEAWRLLQDMVSAFQGMIYWAAGLLSVIQDAPKSPAFVFTNASVIDGLFNYSGTAKKARHSVALVQWRDPADPFSQSGAIEYVESATAIARYGIRELQFVAFGCTSRGQAQRQGRWVLKTEETESETVSFIAGLEGARLRPGDIIQTRDRYRTNNRMGGRIHSVGAGTVTLDAAITVAGTGNTLTIAQTDGSVIEYPITSGAGTITTVAVTGSLANVAAGAVFIHANDAAVAEEWRVMNIRESEPNKFETIAVAFNSQKFSEIETGVEIPDLPTSDLPSVGTPDAPASVTIRKNRVISGGKVDLVLDVNWAASPSPYVVGYKVEFRTPNSEWTTLAAQKTGLSFNSIPYTAAGDYSARVSAINVAGRTSGFAVTTLAVTLDTTPPAVISGLTATAAPQAIFLKWINPEDEDFVLGGSVDVFESATATPAPSAGTAPTWDAGLANSLTRSGLAGGTTRFFWARPVDSSGNAAAWVGPVSATAATSATTSDVSAVQAALDAEVAARIAALSAEASARVADILAEAVARGAAISSEASTRSAADSSLASSITTLTASVGTNAAAIASEATARATADSAMATSIATNAAAIGTLTASVTVLSDAYVVGGTAIATWGFKLDGGGKVVKMQAIAASSGTQAEVGVIVFGGADLQSDTFSTGTSGWQLKANGDAEFNNGTFRGTVAIGSGTNRFYVDTSGTKIGDTSASHFTFADVGGYSVLTFKNGGTTKGFITVDSGTGSILNLKGGNLDEIGTLNAQKAKALSSANPRTTDAPLYTAGGAYVGADVDVIGNLGIDGRFEKRTSDGWTPPLFDGSNIISFQWNSGQIRVLVGATDVGGLTPV